MRWLIILLSLFSMAQARIVEPLDRFERMEYKRIMREYKHFQKRAETLYRLEQQYTLKLQKAGTKKEKNLYLRKLHNLNTQSILIKNELIEVEMELEEFDEE